MIYAAIRNGKKIKAKIELFMLNQAIVIAEIFSIFNQARSYILYHQINQVTGYENSNLQCKRS